VVAVWVMGGSWKAGREGLWVYGRSDCVYGIARRGDEAKSKISNHGLRRFRAGQAVHAGASEWKVAQSKGRADLCTRG